MPRVSILDCFTPPDDYEGDFGWVCGFTANPDVLGEMADRFTRGARRRRVSLAVLLHPPERHLPFRQGVVVPFRRTDAQWNFNLLHAKVALLHFIGADSSMLRLVVSTGNWTREPMTTSLDLFWIVEWRANSRDTQVASDIRAAAAMFEWVRSYFDTSILEVDVGHGQADAAFRATLALLPEGRLPPPRFIDTRDQALQPQVLKAVGRQPGQRNRLVMGSGYFETGENADAGVLKSFVCALTDIGGATQACRIDVVINPGACQGLADQAEDLQRSGWTFRPPLTRDMPGAKLHAKFIFSAGGVRNCTNPWCYIGSGNLSGIGFTRSRLKGGNLEAGVVFIPDEPLTWENGDGNALATRLPVDLGCSVEPSALCDGEAYQPPRQSAEPSPVGYLRWHKGRLTLPEGTRDYPNLTVRLPGMDWQKLPLEIVEPPSVALLGPMMAEVPILTDGGFVLPHLGPKRVEDVLRDFASFPNVTRDDRDGAVADDILGEEDAPVPSHASGDYPTRRMMRLITYLTEHQARIDLSQWERWVNRLEDALTAITVPECEMIEAVRRYGIDPLSALLHAAFLPKSLPVPEVARLAHVIGNVRRLWRLEGLEPLIPKEELP